MDNKETQRLAVVENQVAQMLIAVTDLSKDIKEWQRDWNQGLQTNYVPRQELNEMFRSRDQDIQELRQALDKAANKSDIEDIKTTLKELKEDRKSNKALWAAWAGVIVSGSAVVVAIIALVN